MEVWGNEGWLKVGRRGWGCCWTYRTLGGSSGNRGGRSREGGWGVGWGGEGGQGESAGDRENQ